MEARRQDISLTQFFTPQIRNVICLALLAIMIRLGYLVEPPNFDQAMDSLVGREMMAGKQLYTDIWHHRCPLPYYLYSWTFYVSGENIWSLHLFEIITTVLAGILLYYWLSVTTTNLTAFLAFLAYALLFNHVMLGGWYSRAEPEVFYEIPVVIIFLLSHYIHTKADTMLRWGAFLQGILWAILVLCKLPAILFVICIVADYWRTRDPERTKKFCICLGYFILGGSLIALTIAIWFGYQGNLAAFVRYVLVYNYSYLQAETIAVSAWQQLWGIVSSLSYLAPVAVLGLYGYSRYYSFAHKTWGVMLWPWVAFLQVVWQNKYWWYHFIPCLTPIIVMFAIGLAAFLQKIFLARRQTIIGILGMLVLLFPYLQVCHSYYQYHRIYEYLLGQISYQQLLATYSWHASTMDAFSNWQAGKYIQSKAYAQDKLTVFGFNGSIYLYSHLPPGSRYLFFPYITDPYWRQVVWQEIWEDLAHSPPRFLVVVKDDISFYGLLQKNPQDPWLCKFYDYIMSEYKFEKKFGETILVYVRK